jgi:hypothetical protein
MQNVALSFKNMTYQTLDNMKYKEMSSLDEQYNIQNLLWKKEHIIRQQESYLIVHYTIKMVRNNADVLLVGFIRQHMKCVLYTEPTLCNNY